MIFAWLQRRAIERKRRAAEADRIRAAMRRDEAARTQRLKERTAARMRSNYDTTGGYISAPAILSDGPSCSPDSGGGGAVADGGGGAC